LLPIECQSPEFGDLWVKQERT
ncbi:MAG: hypothetical protein QOE89_2255, partial [Pseudonocardiales bacterium]|nr:hypothetical protein [Pseudonocardiales bacterium]